MKTAAAALLLSMAVSADAAAHSHHCADGCEKHDCAGTDVADMTAEWDKQKAANKGPANGNATSYQPAPAAGTAVVKHEPAFCKVTSGRRLAGHVAANLRVYVAGNDGSNSTLHPMTEAHYIDYLQVRDASSGSHGRLLAAHAGTMLYGKTWQAEKVHSEHPNAGFDFQLLVADNVTHVTAIEHCNLHGLWESQKYAVADIPDCASVMASPTDSHRRLAAHANKFEKIENYDGADGHDGCKKKKDDDDASAGARATAAGSFMAAAAAMVAGLFF